jgi:6-phosphofructokinase 1
MLMARQVNRMVTMENGKLSSIPISEVANQQRLVPVDHPLVQACRATGASFGDQLR